MKKTGPLKQCNPLLLLLLLPLVLLRLLLLLLVAAVAATDGAGASAAVLRCCAGVALWLLLLLLLVVASAGGDADTATAGTAAAGAVATCCGVRCVLLLLMLLAQGVQHRPYDQLVVICDYRSPPPPPRAAILAPRALSATTTKTTTATTTTTTTVGATSVTTATTALAILLLRIFLLLLPLLSTSATNFLLPPVHLSDAASADMLLLQLRLVLRLLQVTGTATAPMTFSVLGQVEVSTWQMETHCFFGKWQPGPKNKNQLAKSRSQLGHPKKHVVANIFHHVGGSNCKVEISVLQAANPLRSCTKTPKSMFHLVRVLQDERGLDWTEQIW